MKKEKPKADSEITESGNAERLSHLNPSSAQVKSAQSSLYDSVDADWLKSSSSSNAKPKRPVLRKGIDGKGRRHRGWRISDECR